MRKRPSPSHSSPTGAGRDDFGGDSIHYALDPVVWFGIIRGVLAVIGIGATEVVRRRVDTNRSAPLARVLMGNAGLTVLALAGFGLTRAFWIAVLFYWLIGVSRRVHGPLYSMWFNQRSPNQGWGAAL